MGIEFFLDDIYQFQCDNDKNINDVVCVFVDTVDGPPFPVRSVDELGMEETDTIGVVEYDNNGSGDVVVEEVSGEW